MFEHVGKKLSCVYPLVNIQKTVENHHFLWVNQLFLWQFSIAMLVHQRVYDLVFSCFLTFSLGFWQMFHIPNFPKKFDGTWLQQGHEVIYIYTYMYMYIIIYRSLRFYGPFGIRGSTLFRENGTRPRRSGCRFSMMWLRSLVKISQGVWWSKAW